MLSRRSALSARRLVVQAALASALSLLAMAPASTLAASSSWSAA